MEAIIVALIMSIIPGLFTWRIAVHTKAARRDIQTNHGKRPGEYLEMVPDLIALLVEHTKQDDKNFAAVMERFDER